MARSIELLFMAQLPWSLWVLVMTGMTAFTRVPQPLAVAGAEPAHPRRVDNDDRVRVLSHRAGLYAAIAHGSSPRPTR